LQIVVPSPQAPVSPDYSPGPLQTEQSAPPIDELDEDDYDYDDTDEEYGFYDTGPANLEEIMKEYEKSRDKMNKGQDDDDDDDEEDDDDEADEKKNEPERTVVEKDFNEGLNLLATEDDDGNEQNESGDEEDDNRKSVSA